MNESDGSRQGARIPEHPGNLLCFHAAEDLNRRAAALHVLSDLEASIVAQLSGLIVVFTGWTPIDPLLSLIVVAVILFSTLRLFARGATRPDGGRALRSIAHQHRG